MLRGFCDTLLLSFEAREYLFIYLFLHVFHFPGNVNVVAVILLSNLSLDNLNGLAPRPARQEEVENSSLGHDVDCARRQLIFSRAAAPLGGGRCGRAVVAAVQHRRPEHCCQIVERHLVLVLELTGVNVINICIFRFAAILGLFLLVIAPGSVTEDDY